MIRVFTGAPTAKQLAEDYPFQWETVSSQDTAHILPAAALDEASRRISLLYQNIVFNDTEDEEDEEDDTSEELTGITWLPTNSRTVPSFLDVSISRSILPSRLAETQDTAESASYDYSDASSIARFPSFSFSLHSLTALGALAHGRSGTRKVSVLLAALEVEGPDTIRIKRGADAGKEVSILKMILGDEHGDVCRLTAWREVADAWGGAGAGPAVKRGDVVLLENITASCDSATAVSLTASPFLKSKLQICYRTMPYTHEDHRLRPDLRLGSSDAAVRKVANLVAWFRTMAGLPAHA